jgi:hypothetical protein
LTPEEHPDYKMLCEAEKKIESLVAYLNERKKVLESQQKIVELVNSVDGIDPVPRYGGYLDMTKFPNRSL